jgi:hypothetical protein
MRALKLALFVGVAAVVITGSGRGSKQVDTVEADEGGNRIEEGEPGPPLSPYWDRSINQWATQIGIVARSYGLDPDLIASVVNAESNGIPDGVSYMGAVGLMGVMPTGPGMEWRPTSDELTDPTTNLTWGGAILADIIRQSGGDIYAALAAYNGGWAYANSRVPQDYAAHVLNDYGRAVAVRSGVSPDMAAQWTVAIEIKRGNIPPESLLLYRRPLSGLRTYGEHVVYRYTDEEGRSYYVKGYAVPLVLLVPAEPGTVAFGSADTLETPLMVKLGLIEDKGERSDAELIRACLPSLTRLRGYMSTRWFTPLYCPERQR